MLNMVDLHGIQMNGFDIWVILLVAIITLLVYTLQGPKNVPPGPRGFPLIGAMLQFQNYKNLHKDFIILSKKYGDVFSFYMGRKLCIVLNSYSSITEAFQN